IAGRPGRGRAYRHVVLAVGRSWDRIDAGGETQTLVLRHQGGCQHLYEHHARVEPGVRRQEAGQPAQVGVDEGLGAALADAAEVRNRGGEQVSGQGERLAVKVPARDDLVRVGKDERVIGGGVHVTLDDAGDVGQRVAQRAVDLRHAADRVSVLHLVAVRVGKHDLAAV